MTQSCAWCHTINAIGHGPSRCSNCSHRADVPRMQCDCAQCAPNEPHFTETPAVHRYENATSRGGDR